LATVFFNFFFLHTLRHDFVPYVMTIFCTLRHEIMTGVMILHQAQHYGGREFAPFGMIFGHGMTSLIDVAFITLRNNLVALLETLYT